MRPPLHLPLHHFLLLLSYSYSAHLALAARTTAPRNDYDPDYLCKTTDVWTRPTWPTNIGQYCSELLDNMARAMPEVTDMDAPLHEFLPVGLRPADTDLVPVRTPWKLSHGPCTLAVTILASLPPGWIPPEIGAPPFETHGYTAWFTIHESAKAVLDHCVMHQKAGMSWYLPDDPQLGIFLVPRGSEIDRVIGQRVNGGGFVVAEGINGTGVLSLRGPEVTAGVRLRVG